MTVPAAGLPWTPADELRKARKQAKLEQAELAVLIGVTMKTISRWENGRGEPSITHWRKIAEVTGAPWLLSGGGHIVTYGDTTDALSYTGFVVVDERQGRLALEPFPPSRSDPNLTLV